MNTITAGHAGAIGATDAGIFQVRYENTILICIQVEQHDAFMAFNDNLSNEYGRYLIRKSGDANEEGPYTLTIPFSQPTSGTLFFSSANALEKCWVMVMTMGGVQ